MTDNPYTRVYARMMQWQESRVAARRAIANKFLESGDMSPTAIEGAIKDAWQLAEELQAVVEMIELQADLLQRQLDEALKDQGNR